MTDTIPLTRDEAIDLARVRFDQRWHPSPLHEHSSGIDSMATAYRASRYEDGWVLAPALFTVTWDARLAESYPYYVVADTGRVWSSPYANGNPVGG